MRIDRIIFICKKKLIRLIERIPTRPKEQSEEEKNAAFSMILQISGHLLRNLPATHTQMLSRIICMRLLARCFLHACRA